MLKLKFHPNKKTIVGYIILFATVTILTLIYLNRIYLYEFSWEYLFLLIYGVIVTPFLIFRFAVTYTYEPVPDRGYRPKVSVIVPVYNEEKGIAGTIDSILNSDYPKAQLELVVIDDKSKDGSLEIIRSKAKDDKFVVLMHEKNMGKRHAMATGIKNCTGEILVCVDSDTIVKPDAIRLLVQPLSDNDVYCVCGNGIVANAKNTLTRFQRVWYADSFRIRKGTESKFGMVICCSGVLAAYRKAKVEAILDKWLNETFLGYEVVSGDDRQLTNLMMKAGGKSVYQDNARAYTFVPETSKKFFVQQLRWGRSTFRGMLFASRFFTKKSISQKFLFYTTMYTNFMAPVTLFMSTVVMMLLGRFDLVLFYIEGLLLLYTISAFNDKQLVNYMKVKDMIYRVFFAIVSIAITFLYMYACLTAWKGKQWLTR